MAVLIKYFFGPVWLAPAILSAKGLFSYPARFLFIVPITLIGLLCLTSAELRADENLLSYRRFIFWKQISYQHIVKCEKSWVPWLGYLRLDGFVFPSGKIYFVNLRPAFTGDPKGLIEFIKSRSARIDAQPHEAEGLVGQDQGKGAGSIILLGIIGVMISLMYAYLFPDFGGRLNPVGLTGVAGAYVKFLNAAVNWPWAFATAAVIIGGIIRYRSTNSVWILALALGTILGNVLAGAFH